MEKLTLRRSKYGTKKLIGVFWLIAGFIFLIPFKNPITQKEWMSSITFWLIGLIYFTPLVGADYYEIETKDGFLKITWYNWIRKVVIPENEIKGILIAANGISIKRKGKKEVRIKLYSLKLEEKTMVYNFFNDYAKSKNFNQ